MDTATDHGKTLAMFLVGGNPIRFTVSHIDGMTIEMRDTDDDVFRAAEELGIDLSRRAPSSAEAV